MAEIVPLSQAVADLVHDGDSVALEGFTHLIPFGAGHEIIRQAATYPRCPAAPGRRTRWATTSVTMTHICGGMLSAGTGTTS
jgi:hypothetical protein